MIHTLKTRPRNLGEVEQLVMDHVWSHGPVSSEACREALAPRRPMKESTIRTVLRRLEQKGYVTHEISGRTFIVQERATETGLKHSLSLQAWYSSVPFTVTLSLPRKAC